MKKHAMLYNRVWEALHADDKFVLALNKTHDEIVRGMAAAIDAALQDGKNTRGIAEAALDALLSMDDAEPHPQDMRRRSATRQPEPVDAFRLGLDPIPDWFMDEVALNHIILYGPTSPINSIMRASIETQAGRLFIVLRGDTIWRDAEGEIHGALCGDISDAND